MNKRKNLSLLKKRHRKEKLFQFYGILALSFSAFALLFLITTIVSNAASGFYKSEVILDVFFDSEEMGITDSSDKMQIINGEYYGILVSSLKSLFPDTSSRSQRKEIKNLVSPAADIEIRKFLLRNPKALNNTVKVPVSLHTNVDQLIKGNVKKSLSPEVRKISDFQLGALAELERRGLIRKVFNWNFFTSGDSRYPEKAGFGGSLFGTVLTLLVCLAISFPLGVASAVYLEEFASKNKFTEFIEVNINNLAAVPSIVFGMLGLAVFLNVFGMPRGTPVVGGTVLALMTLPTIIVAARAAIKAVPPSIRDGALAMGASKVQVVLHHVLPLAMPGTLTGAIIGLSRALGETAPLLMIGMVAFIADVPKNFLSSSTVMPVQIYLWAESAERGFVEKVSAGILIVLVFLVLMNLTAVLVRNKYERRW